MLIIPSPHLDQGVQAQEGVYGLDSLNRFAAMLCDELASSAAYGQFPIKPVTRQANCTQTDYLDDRGYAEEHCENDARDEKMRS
jgi:hypothetical protein